MEKVPLIEKIIEEDGLFYCMDKDDNVVFLTPNKEVVKGYISNQTIRERYAKLLHKYNSLAFSTDRIAHVSAVTH